MFNFRAPSNADYKFCKKIGHEGLKPYIEKIRGWDQALEDKGFNNHWDINTIRIIQIKGEDVGYVKVVKAQSHICLEGIYIHKNWRGKGLGQAVIEELINSTALPIQLKVYKNNPAYTLYKRIGFKILYGSETRYHMEYHP